MKILALMSLTVLQSLSTLASLESAALDRQREEAKVKTRSQSLQSEKEKIEQLKQKRDKLLQKLHNTSAAAASNTGDEDSNAEDQETASAANYLSELKEKLHVYRLTGVSVIKTDPDSKVLRFTTSYHGIYMESYHLRLQRLTSGLFKVIHHDLPSFIVCPTLPASMEVKDVTSVVRPLQEALAMFVLRREELKGTQSKFPDNWHVVEQSAAFDFLCCHLDISSDIQVEITLKYADLNDYLPTSVCAVALTQGRGRPREGLPSQVTDSLQSTFCNSRMCQAIPAAAETLLTYFDSQQS